MRFLNNLTSSVKPCKINTSHTLSVKGKLLKKTIHTFKLGYLSQYSQLLALSPHPTITPLSIKTLPPSIRGLPFKMFLQKFLGF